MISQTCIVIVIAASLGGIFVSSHIIGIAAGIALAVFLALSWRQFTVATWITVSLCAVLLALALLRGIDLHTLSRGLERMAFLATLLALLGALRVVASDAPEVLRAGRYLTTCPPGRRYLAMNFGGHVFGVLINLGGIAILLEMTRRSLEETRGHLPAHLREWRLRRMTTAVLRGFSLAPLWSPIGLGLNAHFAELGQRFRVIAGTHFTPSRAAISRSRAGWSTGSLVRPDGQGQGVLWLCASCFHLRAEDGAHCGRAGRGWHLPEWDRRWPHANGRRGVGS